jgi:hypothetical protein
MRGMAALESESGFNTQRTTESLPTRYGVSVPELDQNTGGLSYQYPIVVPPGRLGLQPYIALQYHSEDHTIDGTVGYGWSLNIPYIERINRTGTQDLFDQSLFSSTFDGELSTTSNSSVFRAKVDTGTFLSYTFSDNTWTVQDKSGVQYTFGASSTARLSNPSDGSQVFRWMLEEVRDTNDNFITYTYTKDSGQLYPSTITYTGHGTTDGPFSVQFTLENRPDHPTSYASGFGVHTTKRISTITTLVDGYWVRTYELGYTMSNNGTHSLLTSVTESARDETTGSTVSIPPTTFTYQDSSVGWTRATSWEASLPSYFVTGQGDQGWQFWDVNGDGLPDLVQNYATITPQVLINTGSGWSDQTASWPIPNGLTFADDDSQLGTRLIDVNGDGRADLVKSLWTIEGDVASSSVYLNTGSGWQWSPDWALPAPLNYTASQQVLGAVYVAAPMKHLELSPTTRSWAVRSSTTA